MSAKTKKVESLVQLREIDIELKKLLQGSHPVIIFYHFKEGAKQIGFVAFRDQKSFFVHSKVHNEISKMLLAERANYTDPSLNHYLQTHFLLKNSSNSSYWIYPLTIDQNVSLTVISSLNLIELQPNNIASTKEAIASHFSYCRMKINNQIQETILTVLTRRSLSNFDLPLMVNELKKTIKDNIAVAKCYSFLLQEKGLLPFPNKNVPQSICDELSSEAMKRNASFLKIQENFLRSSKQWNSLPSIIKVALDLDSTHSIIFYLEKKSNDFFNHLEVEYLLAWQKYCKKYFHSNRSINFSAFDEQLTFSPFKKDNQQNINTSQLILLKDILHPPFNLELKDKENSFIRFVLLNASNRELEENNPLQKMLAYILRDNPSFFTMVEQMVFFQKQGILAQEILNDFLLIDYYKNNKQIAVLHSANYTSYHFQFKTGAITQNDKEIKIPSKKNPKQDLEDSSILIENSWLDLEPHDLLILSSKPLTSLNIKNLQDKLTLIGHLSLEVILKELQKNKPFHSILAGINKIRP